MKQKLSRQEIQKKISKTFSQTPSQKQIKKIKQLAMSKNIKLGPLKKKFCKKCFTFFTPNNSQIRIKKPIKKIKCKNCNHVSRYKLPKKDL
jgi:predicted Zn finger-like uncharacterized protein